MESHVQADYFHHCCGLGSRGVGLDGKLRRYPAAADAHTLDELLSKISAMALDLLPENHPQVDPASLFLQLTALREAELAAA